MWYKLRVLRGTLLVLNVFRRHLRCLFVLLQEWVEVALVLFSRCRQMRTRPLTLRPLLLLLSLQAVGLLELLLLLVLQSGVALPDTFTSVHTVLAAFFGSLVLVPRQTASKPRTETLLLGLGYIRRR